MSINKKWTTHLNFNPKMDNSSKLTPPKWTTHLIYYRGKKSLKLYINYI